MQAPVLLDISRTVARARLPAPTGIDRVERAYIDWALAHGGQFLAAVDGVQYRLGPVPVRALIAWLDGDGAAPGMDIRAVLSPLRDAKLRRAQAMIRRGAIGRAVRAPDVQHLVSNLSGGVCLNVGHDNLSVPLMAALGDAGLKRVVLVHDTIPLDHPEFARPGSSEKFHTKLTAAGMADGVIVNSDHTGLCVQRHLGADCPPISTAALGIPTPAGSPGAPEPIFLTIGTIEPRKNHAMLLDLWQGFQGQVSPPQLVIIGRRGWRNGAVFHRLDTDPMMGRHVIETVATDAELARYLGAARAVLFPSLAEGYGLPMAEALAAGTPVIASDLPALREVGGDVPDYLPANDRAAWADIIRDYTSPDAPRRAAQLARMAHWTRPTWEQHFQIVENTLETILVQASQAR